ncbi:hypothetical protein HDA40_005557 [Hamadaea flava]|nr:hypothetical protein [Hamadaea flava]
MAMSVAIRTILTAAGFENGPGYDMSPASIWVSPKPLD